jgi:hypothetical protein
VHHRERQRDDRSTPSASCVASRQPRRRAPVNTRTRSAAGRWEALAPSLQTVRIAGPSPHSGHHAPPDPSLGCAASNRHNAVAFDPHCGAGRGFLPRGLSDTCPHADIRRRTAASAGRRPTTLNTSRPCLRARKSRPEAPRSVRSGARPSRASSCWCSASRRSFWRLRQRVAACQCLALRKSRRNDSSRRPRAPARATASRRAIQGFECR